MSDNTPPEPIKRPIVIREASPGGEDLDGCFFLLSEVEGFFNFFDRYGRTLATGVSNESTFPFLLDRIAWTIELNINDRDAWGEWQNNVSPPAADGTFQAHSDGDEDMVKSACMPPGAIEIRHVHGGSDKEKLKHCYFMPTTSGQYDFYSKGCDLLQTGLKTDNDFTFELDSIHWTVTEFTIDDVEAHGHWWNPDGFENAQDGTFQAHSDGDMDAVEAVSAASA